MKEVILICLGAGLIAALIIGVCIDYYRNRRHTRTYTGQCGSETGSNVTGGLLFIYAMLASLIMGILT